MPPYDTLPPYTPQQDSANHFVKVDCAYDSVFTPLDHGEPMPRKSLFTHHLLPVRNDYDLSVTHTNTSGWYLGGIGLSILLLLLFLRQKQLSLGDLLLSLINGQTMNRVLRETNLTRTSSQSVIALIILLPIALVAQYLWLPGHDVWSSMINFGLLYAGCCLAYYLRNGILRFIGEAFYNREAVHLYLSSNYLYHLAYGIMTTAMAFFICYTDGRGGLFAAVLGGMLGLFYLMRVVRGMQLILTHAKTSTLYLFYYLCTLEIVPPILIGSYIISL